MLLKVIDGNLGSEPRRQAHLISYLVNEHTAFDAGGLGLMPLSCQKKIHTIFLSHSHADHIATLPLLIDNVYRPGPECITLYANASTVANLEKHVFNDQIWPDVFRLSEKDSPFVAFKVIEHGESIDVDGLKVTAFDTNHTLPTQGYVVDDGISAVALVSDTAPCDSMWPLLAAVSNLRAVFLEISFPSTMQWLADAAKHLTPSQFLCETRKLNRQVDWFITHIKPEFADEIAREVSELGIIGCQYAQSGIDYHF